MVLIIHLEAREERWSESFTEHTQKDDIKIFSLYVVRLHNAN